MIEIVPFTSAHVKKAAELEKICFTDPWSENLFAEIETNPFAVFAAAMDGDIMAGYAGMYHVIDEGQVMNVAVSPDYRRKGIASELLESLILYSKTHGVSLMTLEVRESNAPARLLYTKYGFREVGKRRNYYSLPTENAILMNLEL